MHDNAQLLYLIHHNCGVCIPADRHTVHPTVEYTAVCQQVFKMVSKLPRAHSARGTQLVTSMTAKQCLPTSTAVLCHRKQACRSADCT